jgi:hypothetical protein
MSVFGFVHQGLAGHIEVEVVANTDPPRLGCDDDNLTFPACTASVHYPGGGYQCMFGWIQLVRSSDAGTAEFEMDPKFLFPDADVPFCYFRYKPTLFDCPGRKQRRIWIGSRTAFSPRAPLNPAPAW